MKVLTVRQPWAGLIALGTKDVENRTWAPTRGLYVGDRFAIHAGRRDDLERLTAHGVVDLEDPACHRHGFVLCTVRLVDVIRDSTSEWAMDGHGHWVLDRPRVVSDPPQLRGRTGLWDLHTDERDLLRRR